MGRARAKAMVWVFRPGSGGTAEVLLLQRPPRRGGGFHPVTGKAERGEAPAIAAAREAAEETGLTGVLIDLCFRHEFEAPRGRCIEHAFLLAVAERAAVLLSNEHVDALWTTPDEARARVEWDAHKATLALALAAWASFSGAAPREARTRVRAD